MPVTPALAAYVMHISFFGGRLVAIPYNGQNEETLYE
jgi:hypothetical protein